MLRDAVTCRSTCSRWTATRARRTPAPFWRTDWPGRSTNAAFSEALRAGCIRMTEMLARDGEGAEHLIRATCAARPATTTRAASRSRSINSPLVKTMVHGADPNVGRLLMAVGKCFDCTIAPDRTDAWINGHRGRARRRARWIRRRDGSRDARAEVVDLEVSLGVGDARATAFGCDLTTGLHRRERGVLLELTRGAPSSSPRYTRSPCVHSARDQSRRRRCAPVSAFGNR